MDDDLDAGASWEKNQKRTWDEIQEEGGLLQVSHEDETLANHQRRRAKASDIVNQANIRKGLIRYLVVIVDLSERGMNGSDELFRPTRGAEIARVLPNFFKEFFDQNPMSQLAVVGTRGGLAETLTTFTGTARKHIIEVQKQVERCKGEPSLQNALDVACEMLSAIPKYGTREVLVLWGSLNTIDPGDVFASIEKIKAAEIRGSVVSLAAELYVLRFLATSTNGTVNTVTSVNHLRELLIANVPPAPKLKKDGKDPEASLIHMGFPRRMDPSHVSMCATTGEILAGGYLCPRCKAKVSELPTSCKVCNLTLVSSPHLARSYHHLFPVVPFEEASAPRRTARGEGTKITITMKESVKCLGCEHECTPPDWVR